MAMQSLGAGSVLQNYQRTVTIGQDTHGAKLGADSVLYRGGEYQIVELRTPTAVIHGHDDEDQTLTYIYQADTYCDRCAYDIMRELQANGVLGTIRSKYGDDANLDDERTFDSDDYPKGPYSNNPEHKNFTGYADYPVTCGGCHRDLKHPLYQG